MHHLKMYLLLKMVVFHCYVTFPAGSLAGKYENPPNKNFSSSCWTGPQSWCFPIIVGIGTTYSFSRVGYCSPAIFLVVFHKARGWSQQKTKQNTLKNLIGAWGPWGLWSFQTSLFEVPSRVISIFEPRKVFQMFDSRKSLGPWDVEIYRLVGWKGAIYCWGPHLKSLHDRFRSALLSLWFSELF